jgi:hypothetical protein
MIRLSTTFTRGSRSWAALALSLMLTTVGCDDALESTNKDEDGDESPSTGDKKDAGPASEDDDGDEVDDPTPDVDDEEDPKPQIDAGNKPPSGGGPGKDAGPKVGDGGTPTAVPSEAGVDAPDEGGTETLGDGGFVPPWMTREDLGKGDGKDVITIGDSWMDYVLGGGGIEAGLDRAGTKYRHYGVSATTLLSGQIPGQYDKAKRADPKISTVLMTGGGNDIMFSGGCSTPAECEMSSQKISDGLNTLWTKMAADGVKDVVYIQYAAAAGTTPQANKPTKPPAPAPICLSGKISCHSMPTTDIIKASDLVDGIHPSRSANDKIAKKLLALMEERKMRR